MLNCYVFSNYVNRTVSSHRSCIDEELECKLDKKECVGTLVGTSTYVYRANECQFECLKDEDCKYVTYYHDKELCVKFADCEEKKKNKDARTFQRHCSGTLRQMALSGEYIKIQDMLDINDPLSQTNSPSSDQYFLIKFFLLYEILKIGDWRTDTTCENSDHYRPWLWVGLVDHLYLSCKIRSISAATVRPFNLPLWNETFLNFNVEV